MAIGHGMLIGGAMRPVYGGMLGGCISLLIFAGLAETANAEGTDGVLTTTRTYNAGYNTTSGGIYDISNWTAMNFGPSDQFYLSFPRFDPTMGTLSRVTLHLDGDVYGTYTITASADTVTVNSFIVTLGMSVKDAPAGSTLASLNVTKDSNASPDAPISLSRTGSPFPSSTSLRIAEETEDINEGNKEGDIVRDIVYTEAQSSMLEAFQGTGSKFLYVKGTTNALTDISGNSSSAFATFGRMTGSVTYEYSYSAVPEVGTLFLGGCVIVPLLTHRRRTPVTDVGN